MVKSTREAEVTTQRRRRISLTSPRMIAGYFVLAYACTWWVVPLGSDNFPVFPYGPDLALLLLVGWLVGRRGIRRILSSLTRWRAHPKWYAFVILAPTAVALVAIFGTRLLGADSSAMPDPSSAWKFVLLIPIQIVIGGPLGEELGWRGHVLPALQQRYVPLVAVLLLGIGHVIWHLPLFFTSEPTPFTPFTIELLCGGVVLAWIMNSTGRITLAILLHGIHNASQDAFMGGLHGADYVTLNWLTAAGWAALATIVIWRTRGSLTSGATQPFTIPLTHPAARPVPRGPSALTPA
jgi:membrane protease YdiL (CAAX protease family)